jgi:hypothetical protein
MIQDIGIASTHRSHLSIIFRFGYNFLQTHYVPIAKRAKSWSAPGYPEVKLLGEYGDVPWGRTMDRFCLLYVKAE